MDTFDRNPPAPRPATKVVDCPYCAGTGEVAPALDDPTDTDCPKCGGWGFVDLTDYPKKGK